MGLGEPPRPGYPNLSPRRQWLLFGWARWLAVNLVEYRMLQMNLVRMRDRGNWAILHDKDPLALRYQVIHYRIARARYAVGSFGLSARAVFREDGFVYDEVEAVRKDNAENLDRHYRQPAVRALKLLRKFDVTGECDDQGHS